MMFVRDRSEPNGHSKCNLTVHQKQENFAIVPVHKPNVHGNTANQNIFLFPKKKRSLMIGRGIRLYIVRGPARGRNVSIEMIQQTRNADP